MPHDQHVRAVRPARHGVGDPRLFRARHEVVDKHPVAALRGRRLGGEHRVEQVDTLEILDDDALDAEVIAPDLLNQFGIVPTLDEDPARQRDPGPGVGDRERTRRRAGGRRPGGRRGGGGRTELDKLTIHHESGPQREQATATMPVFKLDVA